MAKKSTAVQDKARKGQAAEVDADAVTGRPMFSLPSRFTASPDPDRRLVHVVDTQSGVGVKVAASSYGEVRRLLGALFGGDVEGEDAPAPRQEQETAPATDASRPQAAARRASSPARKRTRTRLPGTGEGAAAPAGRKAGASVAGEKGADARKASRLKASPLKLSPPAKVGEVAQGWEGSVEGGGYRLDYERDVGSGEPGYSVSASGGQKVATVRRDPKGKFVLRWEDADVQPTPHANLLGVRSRIEVVLDVA